MHRRPQFEPLARLAAAGCGLFGPVTCVWPVYPIGCVCLDPLSCVGSFVRLGVAAAASPPGRSWLGCAAWVWAGCLAFVLRGCVCPAGCCCGGCAAGARLGGCAPVFGLGAWPVICVSAFDLPDVAAAALPPMRSWVGCAAWDWAGCLPFISRRFRLLWRFQAASYLSVFNAFACRLALVTSGGVRYRFGFPPL